MSEHAILAPSSAAIRIHCAGSRALEATYPETEPSQASLDGTAAHWAAAELLAGRLIDTGQIAPNGVMLTDEMVEGAELYVADISTTMMQFPGFKPVIEERIDISVIHPECWGTPDAWIFKPYHLVVWDFKFGHRFVDAFENWQMIEYVAGILERVGITGVSDQKTTVEFRIVQPRCYVGGGPIRTWTVLASDLRGAFNQLRLAEEKSLDPNALCTVNEHCRDCRGRHACQAAQRAAYNAMDVATTNVPFDLDAPALGAELRYVDRAMAQLEARRTGLAEQALALIKQGHGVPFYRAEPSMGRQRWTKPDAEIALLGSMMGVELSKSKLVTPKQALDAGLDGSIVAAYSETPFGETKLKPDDGSNARKIFGGSS